MKGKLAVIASTAVLLLAGVAATTAFAAAGGQGKSKGTSQAAHDNHGPSNTSSTSGSSGTNHDPSNPDGTYRGKSPSKPDQDGIGADHGIVNNDKVGPDTDGNNGCGNDADREDDDNGWCGAKPHKEKPPVVPPTETPTPAPTVTPIETSSGGTNAEVLGATFTRGAGRTLARTGLAILTLMFAAIVLGVIGSALRTIARPYRSD